MSGLKKVFVIFTVAIVLATVSNLFVTRVDATVENPTNTTTENTNTNTATPTDTNTTNTATTDTNTNTDTNTTNTNTANTTNTTNTTNEVDWSKIRNTLPVGKDTSQSNGKLPNTGSNYTLKNTFLVTIFVASAILIAFSMYNKKVGMKDETKR